MWEQCKRSLLNSDSADRVQTQSKMLLWLIVQVSA